MFISALTLVHRCLDQRVEMRSWVHMLLQRVSVTEVFILIALTVVTIEDCTGVLFSILYDLCFALTIVFQIAITKPKRD